MEARSLGVGLGLGGLSACYSYPPAARLYTHALESVFVWLGLRELGQVLAVSRGWGGAVASMAPVRAQLPWSSHHPHTLCASGLARHIASIRQNNGAPDSAPLDACAINTIAKAMTNLEELDYEYDLDSSDGTGDASASSSSSSSAAAAALQPQLLFPSKLRVLCLSFTSSSTNIARQTAQLHSVFRALSGLSELQELTLWLAGPRLDPALRFGGLASAPSLQDLRVHYSSTADLAAAALELNEDQVADLRMLGHLREVTLQGLNAACLGKLLAPRPRADADALGRPHAGLEWQVLEVEDLTDEFAALLVNMPSLTSLQCVTDVRCTSFAFLDPRNLPNLKRLGLKLPLAALPALVGGGGGGAVVAPAAAAGVGDGSVMTLALAKEIVLDLQRCAGLQELAVYQCPFTCAQLASMLSCIPHLHSLTLSQLSSLESLACFSDARCRSLWSSLTHLSLFGCCHPALSLTELRHLHALRALAHLDLHALFQERMDSHCQGLYRPPSVLMPALQRFHYRPAEEQPPPEFLLDEDDVIPEQQVGAAAEAAAAAAAEEEDAPPQPAVGDGAALAAAP